MNMEIIFVNFFSPFYRVVRDDYQKHLNNISLFSKNNDNMAMH